jgi:hypothetical protein
VRVKHCDGPGALTCSPGVCSAVERDVARQNVDVLPYEPPVPYMLDSGQTGGKLEVVGCELLTAREEANIPRGTGE